MRIKPTPLPRPTRPQMIPNLLPLPRLLDGEVARLGDVLLVLEVAQVHGEVLARRAEEVRLVAVGGDLAREAGAGGEVRSGEELRGSSVVCEERV